MDGDLRIEQNRTNRGLAYHAEQLAARRRLSVALESQPANPQAQRR
jgi:hypothetical protein